MKRKTPIKHIVTTHKRKGKTVKSYNRGRGHDHESLLANPVPRRQSLLTQQEMTLKQFNQKVASGEISIERVRIYRFFYVDSFQDFPARNEQEAKSIFKSYEYGTGGLDRVTEIETPEFVTQQYRAFCVASRQIPLKSDFSNEELFNKAYLEEKRRRGIIKSIDGFWKFKGKEYNNVGIPKQKYLKAIAQLKEN